MNGEGQRPPAVPEPAQTSSSDAPEPGNARYPQPGQNGGNGAGGQPGQQGQPAAPPAEGAQAQAAPQTQPGQQQGQHGRHQRHQQQRHQQQQRQQEAAVPIEGVLEVDHRGNGRLRTVKYNFLPQQDDPDVPRHMIDRDKLRPGVLLTGQAVKRNGRLQLIKTDTVEGLSPIEAAKRTAFQNLTVIDPDDRLVMETTTKEVLTRVIDIVAPIGLGQRMLIVSPPKAGKTIMLQKICHAITTNRPDVTVFVLLVDERPEEVTDFRRTVKADVFASSSDRPTDGPLHVAKMALGRANRLVEGGTAVVFLSASIPPLPPAPTNQSKPPAPPLPAPPISPRPH